MSYLFNWKPGFKNVFIITYVEFLKVEDFMDASLQVLKVRDNELFVWYGWPTKGI